MPAALSSSPAPVAPPSSFEDVKVGDTFTSAYVEITSDRIRTFIDATDDYHPQHVDDSSVSSHPVFRKACAQGVFLVSILDSLMTRGWLRHFAHSLNYGLDTVRFVRPVYVGERVRARYTVVLATIRDAQWGRVGVVSELLDAEEKVVLYAENIFLFGRRVDPNKATAAARGSVARRYAHPTTSTKR